MVPCGRGWRRSLMPDSLPPLLYVYLRQQGGRWHLCHDGCRPVKLWTYLLFIFSPRSACFSFENLQDDVNLRLLWKKLLHDDLTICEITVDSADASDLHRLESHYPHLTALNDFCSFSAIFFFFCNFFCCLCQTAWWLFGSCTPATAAEASDFPT